MRPWILITALGLGCSAGNPVFVDGGPGPRSDEGRTDVGGVAGAPADPGPEAPDAAVGRDGPGAGVDTRSIPETSGNEARGTETAIGCAGDGDGRIEADELVVSVDGSLHVQWTVSDPDSQVPVPAATGAPEGSEPRWSFTDSLSGDVEIEEVLLDPASQWFGERFADADFAQPLDATGAVLGVYRLDPSEGGLLLLGIASTRSEDGDWLRYERPAVLLPVPLEVGFAHDSGELEATGRFDGFDYPFELGPANVTRLFHRYELTATRRGMVAVPAGRFDSIQLQVQLTMTARNDLAIVPVEQQTFRILMYVAECVGLVARVRSEEGVTDEGFDRATELRRLGVLP